MEDAQKNGCICLCGTSCLGALIGLIFLLCSIVSLAPDEQVLIYGDEEKYVRNGPDTILSTPLRKREIRKATRLTPLQYAVIKEITKGTVRHEVGDGEKWLFLGAYEELVDVRKKVVLQKSEYMRLVQTLTGYERIESGPQSFIPEPFEEAANGTETAIVMGRDLSVLTFNKTTGLRRLVTPDDIEGMFIPQPYEFILQVRKATILSQRQFALVRNVRNGQFSNVAGPMRLQVGAYEEVVSIKSKLVLEKDQYIRLMDENTGVERIERGPKTLVPEPSEVYPEGIKKATFLDTDTAILVLNESSGQERLIAERGVFFPKPEEEILEQRELIRVLPHEAIVVRDDKGVVSIYSGAAGDAAFFLPPYSVVVSHTWSSYSDQAHASGETKNQMSFTKIDMRMRKMFFSYEVRTADNVKLNLDGTIFWSLTDVPVMMNATSDPEGDVWYHARSALIQAVSQSTLQKFMASFNNITMEAFNSQAQDGFYMNRGVKLSSMELTKFETADKSTSEILQKIIQESTNRVNRLQQQKGENEVKAAELTAEIQMEQQRTEFIKTQAANKKLEARMEGEASGMTLLRAADSFIGGLNQTVANQSRRVELYELHEQLTSHNTDTKNLASGKAELFLTPSNVNLKLAMGGASAESRRLGGAQGTEGGAGPLEL